MLHLKLVVMFVNLGPEFYFFYLDGFLLFLGFLRLLALFIPELAVIHNPADRRTGSRRYFYQVESLGICHIPGIIGVQDTKLSPILVNNTDFLCPNLKINSSLYDVVPPLANYLYII